MKYLYAGVCPGGCLIICAAWDLYERKSSLGKVVCPQSQEKSELEETCMTTYGPCLNFQYWKAGLQYSCDLTEMKYFDFFP